MRICIVSDAYYPYPSGVSEHAHNLAQSLTKKGNSVTILTSHYPGEKKEKAVVRIGRIIFVPLNGTLVTTPLLNPISVKTFFSKNSFDIVHLHGPFFPDISHWALKYSEAPCVATFHTTGFSSITIGSHLYQKVFPFYKKLRARIGVSPVAVNFIKPYIPGDYIIIPNGVDTFRFSPEGNKHSKIEHITGKKILFLGRLDARKGLGQLLSGFKLLIKKIDAHLIVVGTGPERKKYERFVSDNNLTRLVHFLGFVANEDLPSVYRSCDVYCSPALGAETFGIVLLEAMASGIPVAASNIDGYKQVIKEGENGLLFNPKSPEDLAEKLLSILTNTSLRDNLISNGLESAKQYDWQKIAERVYQVYNKTLDKNNNESI